MASHSGHMMPTREGANTRALKIAGWLTGIYFFFELGIGIWTGSIAVLSDAFHTSSAVGGVLIALVAGRYAARAATRFETFGLVRAEIVGALVNGVFLFGMGILVFWMGFMRLQNLIDLPTTPMLVAAAGGLVTEIISLSLLYQGQKTNLNIRGAYWHILQTFAGSVIVIVSALVIRFTDFLAIDPLLGMAFGFLLFWASWGITRDSLSILLDNVPKDLDINAAKDAIEAVPGVESVHHLHAWSLTTGKNILSAHVLVEQYPESEPILQQIQSILKDEYQIYFSTIQVESEICPEIEQAEEIDFLRQPAMPSMDGESHQSHH